MKILQGILLILFLAAILLFVFQNGQAVTIWFFKWSLTAPLALVSLGTYLLGMATGWAVLGFLRKSLRTMTDRSN